MTNTSLYRFIRRKVAAWAPQSMLGRLALYMFLLRVGVFVTQQALLMTGRAASARYFNGLAAILTFLLGSVLIVLVVRWVRTEMLWRLRNRLIVTYVFIGVIPVLLILTMVGIAGYMFSNQYVTSEVRVDLDKEIRSLEVVAQGIAPELSGPGSRAEDARWQRRWRNLERRFPGLEVTAWQQGRMITLHGSDPAHAQRPAWIQDDFQGLVGENGQLFLCAIVKGSAETLVMFRVPLNKSVVDRSAAGLGEVRFFNLIEIQGKPAEPGGLVISEQDDSQPDAKKVNFELAREPVASGGTVPPHGSFRYDPELSYVNPVPFFDWTSGASKNAAITVITRPSALVDRLFLRTGRLGDVLLGVLAGVAIFFGLIVIVALFFGVGLTRTITSSVYNLYQATQEINRGNLKHRIPVKNKDQLAALQVSFNSMAENLEKLIEEQKEKERLESELAIAQEVQATLFPLEAASIEALEVHGVCKPARSVSGDYYDFLPGGDRQLGIAVGDISGKGISAALLMATVHSAVRAYEFGRMPTRQELVHAGVAAAVPGADPGAAGREWVVSGGMQSPAVALELLNRHLYHSTQPEKYATLFLGVYDGGSRTMTYSNAGHLPPLIIGQDGSVRRLEIGGTVIGLFDEVTYEESSVVLRPNDIFVAYSDGITEPENEFGEFGEQRLLELIRANRNLPLARISEIVTTAVQDWIGAAEQPDDVTLVLARAL